MSNDSTVDDDATELSTTPQDNAGGPGETASGADPKDEVDDDDGMISDAELIAQHKRDKSAAKADLGTQYSNTEECQEFYAGDFMSYRDRIESQSTRGKRRQVIVEFNKVKPYVNSVKGFMAQNRRKAKYFARIPEKAVRVAYSEHCNGYADFTRERGNFDQHETQQDGDMLINGYGALETAISYGEGYATTDPNGEVIGGRLDPMSCYWDSSAKAPNLLDRRYCGYTQEYHVDVAEELFDAPADDFDESQHTSGQKQYMPGGGPYTAVIEDMDWANKEKRMVYVDFYQWYEIEDYYRAQNPLINMTADPLQAQFTFIQLQNVAALSKEDSLFTLDPKQPILDCTEEQKEKLAELFPDMEFVTFKRKAFFGAVLSGKRVFSKFRLLTQQGFTIQFKTGDRDEKKKIWVGMVNSMKDPIVYYNRALTELMFTIASGSKGGVMYEKGAIRDIRKFEANYGKTNANVEVEEGALTAGRIKPKREVYQPTGLEQLIQMTDNGLAEVTGLDKSFLGSSENKLDTASLLRQRIKQVTSVLACYFDAISLYQKTHSRIMLDFMRVMVKTNPTAMFRVTGDDGQDDLEAVDPDKFAAEYDVTIQEAPETADEKEERAKLMVAMGRDLLAIQDPAGKLLYGIALKDLPLDSASRAMVMKALMPDQAQIDPAYVHKLEDTIKQLTSEMQKAGLQKILSEIQLNVAKTDKTQAETQHSKAKVVDTLETASEKSAKTHLLHRATHATAIV